MTQLLLQERGAADGQLRVAGAESSAAKERGGVGVYLLMPNTVHGTKKVDLTSGSAQQSQEQAIWNC
jgi:hypothetical protein